MMNNNKQRLLELIVKRGILHDSERQPLVARDGCTPLSWVMNFLAVSLESDHLRLAARQMLTLLNDFEGRQLATIGTAAVPLLSACLLESDGEYSGLMVRAQRKSYGTASLIDGRIKHAEPVIVIDDSIGSGTNMLDCIEKLEAAGLYVEGCACLVRFGYDSGYAQLIERGYRVAYLFDNARDIARWHPTDWQYDPYPLKSSLQHIEWDDKCLADAISPFLAIRQSIEHFWQTGKLLRPPRQFNQPIDTAGGVWLSLRAQDDQYTPQGRYGCWNFPDELTPPLAERDISHVAWLLAHALKDDPNRAQRLEHGALALSALGKLEACMPGDLDNRQYGIVLRSTESPWKMGGALPNMPGVKDTAQQLHHARYNNAKLFTQESCQLYRHTVTKLVEPGAEWPHGGTGRAAYVWDEHADVMQPLVQAVLEGVHHWHQHGQLAATTTTPHIPNQCNWLFLTVYKAGHQLACMGVNSQQENALAELVKVAAQDERWQAVQQAGDTRAEELYIKVAVLSDETLLGNNARLEELPGFVAGQDAIVLCSGQQLALILPEVPLEQQWNMAQLNDALYQKAGLVQQEGQQLAWYRYRTVSWHADATTVQLLRPQTRLPQLPSAVGPAELVAFCEHFLRQHCRPDGVFNSHYQPNQHQAYHQDSLFTTAVALWLLKPGGDDQRWEASYKFIIRYITTETEQPVSNVERAYAILALSVQLQTDAATKYRPFIAQQLEQLQAGFNRHGQLPRPQQGNVTDIEHYGIELYALLQLLQQGFHFDTRLLQRAVCQLLVYVERQATPRQFPVLLQTLALARSLCKTGLLVVEEQALLKGIDRLVQGLLQWQQAEGGFLPEDPEMAPVMFSVRAMSALAEVGVLTGDSLHTGLVNLKHYMIQPEQACYFAAPDYAVGGVYSGSYDGSLSVLLSAQLLWLLRWVHGQDSKAHTRLSPHKQVSCATDFDRM